MITETKKFETQIKDLLDFKPTFEKQGFLI